VLDDVGAGFADRHLDFGDIGRFETDCSACDTTASRMRGNESGVPGSSRCVPLSDAPAPPLEATERGVHAPRRTFATLQFHRVCS
jgi:hypothetical protein